MYMTVPAQAGEQELWKQKSQHLSLAQTIAPLENNLSSEEYNKFWQDLRHAGRELDQLYESCRTGTFLFKDKYEEIKKAERLNEALRQGYYNALSTKKKHEEDRDTYFNNDKDLIDMKENFIEETQSLALSNSQYIEYNQRFSQKREEFLCKVLADVSKVNEQNNKLKTETSRLRKELGESQSTVHELRIKMDDLKKHNDDLDNKCKLLEQKRDQLKKEAEWMMRQNNKLKDSNARFEREFTFLSEDYEVLKEEKKQLENREKELENETKKLNTRCAQLQDLLDGANEQLSALREETDNEKTVWQKEKEKMTKEVEENKRKAEKARQNNHNTLMKNQQLREKLRASNHKAELISKEKLKSTLKEHKTKRTNAELASHQLGLINEILELKSDFFRDQQRIQKGAKLNRRLESDILTLKQRMQLLKENPSAIDPLDGAHECRELTRLKYGAQRRFVRSSSVMRPATSVITKVQ